LVNYPQKVTVVEVGPRDGLQSFHRSVDTETKVRLVDRLSEAGFPIIEVTGFVHPKFIPNLVDAEAVVERMERRPGTIYRALVPNLRGAQRAAAVGRLDELVGLSTASIRYTKLNQNMTIDATIDQGIASFKVAETAGMGFVMAIGVSMWCPFDGPIPQERVLDMVARLYNAGIRKFNLGGSLGMEDPRMTGDLFSRILDRYPNTVLAYHIHNMSGTAPASVLAAMDAGAQCFEGSICGIGGGVATPHAVGNIPTENIVQMFNDMGVSAGVETEAAIAAARDCAELLKIPRQSEASRYGSRSEQYAEQRACQQEA
jgi:hydroxymethylglutaryl-CoA lyase